MSSPMYSETVQSSTAYQQMQPTTTTTSYQSTSYPSGTYQTTSPAQYAQYTTHAEIPTGQRMITGQERVQTTRKVSSTVVNEQFLGPMPQDYPVREIEVPGPVQEIVKHVPRKEVVETEKRVPRYEYEWVERVVEIPRIEYIDKTVEVPQYQEVIREVRVPQIVDMPKEVIREVKVPKINYVEKVVEVPGQIIEVPKPYTVEQKVEVTRYVDRMHPVVVAQMIKPYIVEGVGNFEVDVYRYEPECVPIDIHVVKAVQAKIEAGGVVESGHRVITVPAAQYNTILQQLNVHLTQAELQRLPYMSENGQVTFLGERAMYAEPQHGISIAGLDTSNLVRTHVDAASKKVMPLPGDLVGMSAARGQTAQYSQTTTTTTQYGAAAPMQQYGATSSMQQYGASVPMQQYGGTSSMQQYGGASSVQQYGGASSVQQYGGTSSMQQYGAATAQGYSMLPTTTSQAVVVGATR